MKNKMNYKNFEVAKKKIIEKTKDEVIEIK